MKSDFVKLIISFSTIGMFMIVLLVLVYLFKAGGIIALALGGMILCFAFMIFLFVMISLFKMCDDVISEDSD